MLAISVVCSIAILFNGYILRLGTPSDSFLMFWLPITVLGLLMFYAAFTFDSKYPLVLIMVFAFTLHMLQFVRQPAGMIWSADSIYVYQVVENIFKTGQFTFGSGTGMAPTYTYYPIFHIFLSSLSSITSLSPMIIVKYSMAILNLASLLGFYALLSLLKLDSRSKNLILCVFNLNPMFHYFNSYAHAESFAIIFYPLILLYALRQSQPKFSVKNQAIALFFLAIVTMSHHFTSYMTALALVAVPILLYFICKKTLMRTEFSILALILPLSWLAFVSVNLFSSHITTFTKMISNLTELHLGVGYSVTSLDTSIAYYPSALSMQITSLRNLLLVAVTFLGFLWYIRHKEKTYTYFGALLLFGSAITFVSMFLVDWSQVGSVPRTRFIEFLFYPIAIFFALGTIKILRKIANLNNKSLRRRLIQKKVITLLVVLILVVIFVPSTIFNAFPRYNYDQTYSPVISTEFTVAPETQYALGRWVLAYSNTSEKDVFAGSSSAHRYVIGYGLQEKWANEIFDVSSIESEMNGAWWGFSLYYVVNHWNVELPDGDGRKVDDSTIDYLNGDSNRIYDNRVITLYRKGYNP
jgi:hypothetical protein